jgi:hypothetical protein
VKQSKDAIPSFTENGAPESPGAPGAAVSLSVEELATSGSAPPRDAVGTSEAYHCFLAVQGESGYLIPVVTSRDLLFELKQIWQR